MITVPLIDFSQTLYLLSALPAIWALTVTFIYVCIKEYKEGIKKRDERIKKLEEDYNNLQKDYENLVDVNNVFSEEGGE